MREAGGGSRISKFYVTGGEGGGGGRPCIGLMLRARSLPQVMTPLQYVGPLYASLPAVCPRRPTFCIHYTSPNQPAHFCFACVKQSIFRFAGDIQAFADQIRLVFANCLAYNPPGCWARTWGESCGGAFEVR